jgi:dihydroorotate dehydrogenase (NAD+) catalytic subunit
MSERNQVQAEVNMEVNLGGIALANPVTVASGTFGYGREYEAYVDLARLGAIIVKGTTLEPRAGNPTPRIIETPAGMLNAVGLQNPGVDVFIQEHLPYLREKQATVIVNIAGNTVEEYARLTAILDKQDGIAGLEVNISCPNVEKGGLQFGTDPEHSCRGGSRCQAEHQSPGYSQAVPQCHRCGGHSPGGGRGWS